MVFGGVYALIVCPLENMGAGHDVAHGVGLPLSISESKYDSAHASAVVLSVVASVTA